MLSTFVALGSGRADTVPEIMILKAALWPKPTKSPVVFAHKKHHQNYENDCAECHHTYTDGVNTWIEGDPVPKCHQCHNEPTIKDEDQLPKKKQKLNLKLAFHNSCRACHTHLKKKDSTRYQKIPTECNQCHQDS